MLERSRNGLDRGGKRGAQGGRGSRGPDDHRRRGASRGCFQVDGVACPRRQFARRRVDPRAGQRRDGGARLHLSSRRRDLARREVRGARHGHQRPVEPLLRRTGDRHRAGLSGRRLHSVSRQYRREPGSPARSHPVDARARRRRSRSRAGHRDVAERAQTPARGAAGRSGDATAAGPQGVVRRPRKQGWRAQSHRTSDQQTDTGGSPSSADWRRCSSARSVSPGIGWRSKMRKFRSRVRWSSTRQPTTRAAGRRFRSSQPPRACDRRPLFQRRGRDRARSGADGSRRFGRKRFRRDRVRRHRRGASHTSGPDHRGGEQPQSRVPRRSTPDAPACEP